MNGQIDVWDPGCYELAEGVRRVGARLLFVDILSGRLLEASTTDPGDPLVLLELDVPLGAVAPVAGRADQWIAAAGTGIAILDADGQGEWLARPEEDGPVARRMNDGACDPHGRFWAGSMAYDATPGAGSLYRVDHDGSVERVLTDMTIVNGPAFDATGSLMYIADTPTGRIFRHSLDASGAILDSELFVQIRTGDGSPDGMTVDDRGRLWVALWGGSRVNCYDREGDLAEVVRLPARQPTSVCLGNNDEGKLFVTTAAHGLGDPAYWDGAVLCARVDASAPSAQAWVPWTEADRSRHHAPHPRGGT